VCCLFVRADVDIFVQGSSVELPKNGPFWHEIREVALPDVMHAMTEFNSLLKVGAAAA